MSFGSTAKQVLATVAPLLGTALGGPFGGLAGSMLAKALGTTDPAAQEAAITSTDPDILLKLKQADTDFQAQMKALQISEEKLVFDDVANARGREIAVKAATPHVLAYLTTAGFFLSLLGAFFVPIPDASKGIVFTMIGSLGTVWITQMGFYFGSSMGSDHKTDILASVSAVAAAKTK
jgi:hypothetical protein